MELLGRSRFGIRHLADGFEIKRVTRKSRALADRRCGLIEVVDVLNGTRPKRMGGDRDLADRREGRVTIADVTERRRRVLEILVRLPIKIFNISQYLYQNIPMNVLSTSEQRTNFSSGVAVLPTLSRVVEMEGDAGEGDMMVDFC